MRKTNKAFLLICWIAIWLPCLVYAQSKPDSLKITLNKSTDPQEQADILKQLSRISFQSSDYVSAIYYLNMEIQKDAEIKDSVSWANAYFNLGMANSVTRDYNKARNYSLLASRYFERNAMFIPLANTYINLGFIYDELKLRDQAFNYYQKALKILVNFQNQGGLDASFLNLGLLGKNQDNLDGFRKYYEDSQGLSNRINSASLSLTYFELSKLVLKKNDLVSAESFAVQGLEIAVKNKDQNSIANGQIQLGKVYHQQGNEQQSRKMLEQGLIIARNIKDRSLTMEAYAELSRVSMALNQPSMAYKFLDSYVQLKDSIYNEQMALQISQASRRFGTGSDDLNPENLLRENLDQTQSIQKNHRLRIALFISLSLLLVLLVFFFVRYHSSAKVAKVLKEKNTVIEDQKTKLEQMINTKDRFFSIIAHDLKNPFNSLLGYADLAYNDFDEISDTEKKSHLNVIRQSGQQIYALLDNLLNWSRAQSGRIDFNPEPVNLTENIENAIELVRSSADNKLISLFTDFSKDVIVKADKNMLSTILRNLLTNAIKFTPDNGMITVSTHINSKKVTVSITDTGVGMNEDELSRLFKLDGNLKHEGTNKETGTGLGLILCQEFMNLHKSKIIAESTPGKGSTFSFSLDTLKQF